MSSDVDFDAGVDINADVEIVPYAEPVASLQSDCESISCKLGFFRCVIDFHDQDQDQGEKNSEDIVDNRNIAIHSASSSNSSEQQLHSVGTPSLDSANAAKDNRNL